MKTFLLILTLLLTVQVFSQAKTYEDSLKIYFDEYVKDHEVVTSENKSLIQFYPADENYRVTGKFTKATNNSWFSIPTSGTEKKLYRVFGTVSFKLGDSTLKLNIYQSQSLMSDPKYKDYLLLMFTDVTSGNETYEGGRYLDFMLNDIKNNILVIDFNKAYNPYCAYEKDKYNCPLPPKENDLPIEIRAGEKKYQKKN